MCLPQIITSSLTHYLFYDKNFELGMSKFAQSISYLFQTIVYEAKLPAAFERRCSFSKHFSSSAFPCQESPNQELRSPNSESHLPKVPSPVPATVCRLGTGVVPESGLALSACWRKRHQIAATFLVWDCSTSL